MCDFRFKDLSSIDCNLPTGCQQFVDFESSCHLEPSDNRKYVCVRRLVGHHFLWKVNESFSLKIVYERVMIRTLLGTLHPKGMGGIMSCWTITKRRTRIYRIVFFFLMKENHFGNILGNKIYLTLAPDVFSYLFLSLPFCCRKPLEPP